MIDRTRGRSHVVLVAEDDDAIAELLVGAINDQDGFVAIRAADGSLALRALETVKVDVALLDVELPGMSGLEVYDRMKQDDRFAKVPVIFETGTAPEHAPELRSRGVAVFVRKPFDLNDVVRSVRSLAGLSAAA